MAESLKFGRRPPSNKPALRFSQFWSGVTPDHPVAVDYLARLKDWQMLGNDQIGDCVAVTAANARRLVSALLSKEAYPTYADVIAFYRTQNPGYPKQDDGMDIQTALEWWNKNAWGGAKVVAFAQVDFHNLDAVKAAISIFGFVWLGVNVQGANLTDFDAGKPWTYHPSSTIDGGHSIVAGGYAATTREDVRFITWGQETSFTDTFWNHLVEECWIAIMPEHLGTTQFRQGIDLAALAAAFKQITGKELPLPTPVPTPIGTQWVFDLAQCSPRHIVADWK